MCFRIHHDHTRVKTATKDIVCYKKLRVSRSKKKAPGYISPFRSFFFEKGECYHEDKPFVREKDYWGRPDPSLIATGIHSYSSFLTANLRYKSPGDRIIKCVIPKYSKYYYDPRREEYVSDYLIIDSEEYYKKQDLKKKTKK